MEIAKKFEIHYFLQNDSHSMDAIIKNQCEAEFLAIAYEIINQFDFDITLNAEALREGGIKAIWDILGKNSGQIVAVCAILTPIFSCLAIPNSKLVQSQIIESVLSIEEKKLSIDKMKKEAASGEVNKETVDSVVSEANKNPKIIKRKSNFYQKLLQNQEVTKIGFSSLDKNSNPINEEAIVYRKDFINYIVRSNKLPVETIDNAKIEIIAPVLREGKAKWKGLYERNFISFNMNDVDYKTDVLAKKISFKCGDIIICVLEIHKEINDVGEIIVKEYRVETVLDKIENGAIIQTQSGKKHRHEQSLKSKQYYFDV